MTIRTNKSMRYDECANLLNDYVNKCADQHAFIEEPIIDRIMRNPNYGTLQIIDGLESNAEILVF